MNFLYENLIADGAYKPFLYGLGVTLLITAVGLFLGTIVGAILCAFSRCRFKILHAFSRVYFIVVGGTPALLQLMLFYYVILAPFRINAVFTAFIAFGLKVGVNIGEIMKSALASVDRGQIQAARTLGFTSVGAFFNVALPQAVRFGRNVYQTTVIDLLQATSIAGYITIAELTRVVNGMQARTGQPFISMMIGIVLYLFFAAVINIIFQITQTKKMRLQG